MQRSERREEMKQRKENLPEIRGWTRIIVETDEKDPVVIATITADETDVADGYRVRLRPVYERKGRGSSDGRETE